MATGSAKISFRVTYKDADGQSYGPEILDYFVQVQGTAPKQESDQETQTAVSTPRVIVTGFTTEPETVYAGDTFQLTLSLKNTSKTTAVKNLLFDIQATQEGSDTQTTSAAFLPTAGSSTIFVDSIGADSSKNITIELKSKADLSQKPYVIQVGMEYEDSKANPFTETASVSIPVKQEAKVDMSTVDLMPGSIEVGGEANVMFSLYNTGKTKLYNVNVKFIADSISGGDTFLGNLEPGATANVDAYLYGIAATMDDGTVKIEIHYEDEEGNPAVIEQSTTVFVSETYMEDYTDDFYPEDMEEETSSSKPMLGIVIGILLVLLCGVVAFLILKVKRKKAKQQETEELELLEDEES